MSARLKVYITLYGGSPCRKSNPFVLELLQLISSSFSELSQMARSIS